MRWLPVAVPPSAATLFTKARVKPGALGSEFSRAQQFVAALHAYTALPAEARLGLVRDYGAHLAAVTEARPADASPASPAASKLLAARKARTGKAAVPA